MEKLRKKIKLKLLLHRCKHSTLVTIFVLYMFKDNNYINMYMYMVYS